jgi:hypothetical protein
MHEDSSPSMTLFLSGEVDEDDADDEKLFMAESMELHYNISEIIGIVTKTHGHLFYPIFHTHLHSVIIEMSNVHCLKVDRNFAFYVVCDIIEFGLSSEYAGDFINQIIPILYGTANIIGL